MVASEERIVGKFGMELYPLLCSKQVTNKDLLYGTGNSAQPRMLVWMGVESGGSMDPCICMAESLRFSPETLITLLIGYTPIQNKKSVFLFCFWEKEMILCWYYCVDSYCLISIKLLWAHRHIISISHRKLYSLENWIVTNRLSLRYMSISKLNIWVLK